MYFRVFRSESSLSVLGTGQVLSDGVRPAAWSFGKEPKFFELKSPGRV